MRKSFVVAGILSTFVAGGAMAELLYSESFEDPDMLGGKYYDTQDVATDHWLFNNDGEAAVNGANSFSTYYISTGGVGLGDGDYFGVTDYTGGGVGSYYDGVQGYQMSDVDGIAELHFTGYEGAADLVTVAIFIASTGWESADFLSFHYGDDDLTGGLAGDLNLWNEPDLEDNGGVWLNLSFTPSSEGHFHIAFASNSGTEAVFVDAVNIYSGAIPAPGALALLGLAGLASRRRRK
jgi:MYXO-CTERM domain-containing protein